MENELHKLVKSVYILAERVEGLHERFNQTDKKIDRISLKIDQRIDGPEGLQVQTSRNTEELKSWAWKWKATLGTAITLAIAYVFRILTR